MGSNDSVLLHGIDTSPNSPTFPPDPPLNENAGVGLSDPQFGTGRRRMLDLVNRLHSTGVQVDIDLPQIAVIGSQSAGKSSLIESISGITLPRASGTCTRCPTECRLSRSDSPWQCVVSLRFSTDANGQPLGQSSNKQFGDVIYDKSEVEDRIRQAQLAILNPDKPMKYFLDGLDDDGSETQLSFSSNCVTLQISGPDVADLSFCDLPGLIVSQTGSRGSNDIELVRNLVKSYISKPSCIILLTVTCETDFENQGAHRITKEFDQDGKRTIGVLTKPDRIQAGEESDWLPYIRNEKEPLENGWFCVRQPSSEQLKRGITWEQARALENQFFSSQAPWSDLGIYQGYLRTSNLVKRLSAVLSDLIAKRLPQIQEELEKSLQEARDIMWALPKEPSSDPRSEISSLLHVFTTDLSRHVEGVPDNAHNDSAHEKGAGLIQRVRPAQDAFRRAIRATEPNFRPFERKDGTKYPDQPPVFLKREDDTDDSKSPLTVIYIDDVLRKATRARTRELPGHYPFAVQRGLIDDVVTKWRSPAAIMCKAVHAIVSEHVKALVTKHFAEFGQGTLEARVSFIVHHHMKRCLEQALERINWLLQLENAPFSLNTHYFSDYRQKFFAFYKSARNEALGHEFMSNVKDFNENPAASSHEIHSKGPLNGAVQHVGIAKVLSGLDEVGLHGVKPEDLAKLLPPDPMEDALAIMADVRAYFQVAYKRVSDNRPLAIDHELVRGAERGILQVLYSQLGIHNSGGHLVCAELAQESPQIASRRAELKKKIERLENASGELLSLGA